MKFQNILLFTVAASFALANSLEVSDTEDVAPVKDDTGVASEPEGADTHLDTEVDTGDVPADEEKPQDDVAGDDTPADEEKPEGDVAEDDTPADSTDVNDDTVPGKADAGEASDDYGDDKVDGKDVDDEGSDDYGEEESTEGTNNIEDHDANDAEASDDEDEGASETTIAAGIAGAAALSSAGIFLWVKRSKRSEVESSPLNMA